MMEATENRDGRDLTFTRVAVSAAGADQAVTLNSHPQGNDVPKRFGFDNAQHLGSQGVKSMPFFG